MAAQADILFPQFVSAVMDYLYQKSDQLLSRQSIDSPEYVADIYCMERVANIIGLDLMAYRLQSGNAAKAKGQELEEMKQAEPLKAILERAYSQAGIDEDASCINLRDASIQSHV